MARKGAPFRAAVFENRSTRAQAELPKRAGPSEGGGRHTRHWARENSLKSRRHGLPTRKRIRCCCWSQPNIEQPPAAMPDLNRGHACMLRPSTKWQTIKVCKSFATRKKEHMMHNFLIQKRALASKGKKSTPSDRFMHRCCHIRNSAKIGHTQSSRIMHPVVYNIRTCQWQLVTAAICSARPPEPETLFLRAPMKT